MTDWSRRGWRAVRTSVLAAAVLVPGQVAAAAFTFSIPRLADTAYPFATAGALGGIACAPEVCVVAGTLDGVAYLSASGGGGWTPTPATLPGAAFGKPACPSREMCAAPYGGQLYTSTDPLHGAWTVTAEPAALRSCTPHCAAPSLLAVACPTSGFCVAGTGLHPGQAEPPAFARGYLLPVEDPATGRWGTPVLVDRLHSIEAIACPDAGLCVAVDDNGSAFSSATPDSGGWVAVPIEPGVGLTDITCPSEGLCVAGDAHGAVYATSTPRTGGWHRTPLRTGRGSTATYVSCAAPDRCVAASLRSAYVTTAPLAGHWIARRILADHGLTGVACSPGGPCVASADSGLASVAAEPVGGPWLPRPVLGESGITDLACASESLCLGVDAFGHLLRITIGPGPPATAAETIDPGASLSQITCAGPGLCAALDDHNHLLTSSHPLTPGAWARSRPDPRHRLRAIACPTTRRCFAVDDAGWVLRSDDPGSPGPHWGRFWLARTAFIALACPAAEVCVAVDDAGRAWSSGGASRGPHGWRVRAIPGVPYIGARSLSCPSTRLCVALAAYETTPDCCSLDTFVTDPLHGPWRVRVVAAGYYGSGNNAPSNHAMTCPSVSECVAVTGQGDALRTTAPLSGPWTLTPTADAISGTGPRVGVLESIACPAPGVCLAGDSQGNLLLGGPTP